MAIQTTLFPSQIWNLYGIPYGLSYGMGDDPERLLKGERRVSAGRFFLRPHPGFMLHSSTRNMVTFNHTHAYTAPWTCWLMGLLWFTNKTENTLEYWDFNLYFPVILCLCPETLAWKWVLLITCRKPQLVSIWIQSSFEGKSSVGEKTLLWALFGVKK